MTDLFNRISAVTQTSYWTEEQLKALDRKSLYAIATYNGKVVKSTPVVQELLKIRPIGTQDSRIALKIYTSADYKTTIHVRPDAYLANHGGKMTYDPKTVTYVDLAGKQMQRDNLPIPLPFGVQPKYDNLVAVASFAAQTVRNHQGVWESSINTASWSKVFATGVAPAGMQSIASAVSVILTESKMWQAMTQINRNAVQGQDMLSFVAVTLNSLSPKEYWYLNTLIVFHGLTVMQETAPGRWIYCKDDQDKKVVDESVYTMMDPSGYEDILTKFPAVFKYNGGLKPAVVFPAETGTFKHAVESQSRLREIQGSDSSCTAMLSQMRGYSGLTDDYGRRVQFITSAVLACWQRSRKVNIQLHTVGDLPMITSSLNTIKKMLLAEVETSSTEEENDRKYYFKFLLPGVADRKNVPRLLHTHITNFPEEDCVVVMFDPGNLPTSEQKGTSVDYESASQKILPDLYQKNDVIMYTIIFGDYPFPRDKEMLRNRSRSTNLLKPWTILKHGKNEEREIFVYAHSTASGFRGVLSTLPDLKLVGYGPKPIYNKIDDVEKLVGYDYTVSKAMHPLPLRHIKTQEKWYNEVIADCQTQAISWLNPVARYSGISNLMTQSKTATMMATSMVHSEDGLIPVLTTRRAVKVEEEVVNFHFKPQSSSSSSFTSSSTTAGKTSVTTDFPASSRPFIPEEVRPKIVSQEQVDDDDEEYEKLLLLARGAPPPEEDDIKDVARVPRSDDI